MNHEERIAKLMEVENRVIDRMHTLVCPSDDDVNVHTYGQLQREPLMQLTQILKDTINCRMSLQKHELDSGFDNYNALLDSRY